MGSCGLGQAIGPVPQEFLGTMGRGLSTLPLLMAWQVAGSMPSIVTPMGSCGLGQAIVSGTAGVSRYNGEGFVNFTTADGLASSRVYAIHRDPDGVMWFGTYGGGLSRYDGKDFVNFTTKDGLAANGVGEIYRDPDGVMWFGDIWWCFSLRWEGLCQLHHKRWLGS